MTLHQDFPWVTRKAGGTMLTRAKRAILTNIPADRMWSWFMFLTREPQNKSRRAGTTKAEIFPLGWAKAKPAPGERWGSRDQLCLGMDKTDGCSQRKKVDKTNGDENKEGISENNYSLIIVKKTLDCLMIFVLFWLLLLFLSWAWPSPSARLLCEGAMTKWHQCKLPNRDSERWFLIFFEDFHQVNI